MAIESTKILMVIAVAVTGVFCIFIGIGSWCLTYMDGVNVTTSTKFEQEYMRVNVCIDSDYETMWCTDFKPSVPPHPRQCDCDFPLTVKNDLEGEVTLYYTLPEFNQSRSDYVSSKDEKQLLGLIRPEDVPADSCGNFSYKDDIPIFPCGEIADSMFNDTFLLLKDKEPVPVEYTNLLATDIIKYRNPSQEVLKNHTTPKNWSRPRGKQPWENYEGALKNVENTAFQAWMNTSMPRKPVWRIQRNGSYANGLPAGNYTLSIIMRYGVDRYAGPRVIILEGVRTTLVPGGMRNAGAGATLIVLAFVLLALGGGFLYKQRKGVHRLRLLLNIGRDVCLFATDVALPKQKSF